MKRGAGRPPVKTGMGMGRTGQMTGKTPAAPAANAGQGSVHPAAQASRDMQDQAETRNERDRQRRWNAYRSITV